jgi:hypothetical protein
MLCAWDMYARDSVGKTCKKCKCSLRTDIGVMISYINGVDIAMHNRVMGFIGRSVEK